MKKALFYTSVVIAFLLLVSILNILLFDLSRLTNYGYGYLVGKIILLLLFCTAAYFSKRRKVA